MAGVPEARVRELLATLWPAAPGVAVAVATLVLAVAVVVVALFRDPLTMAACLVGLVLAAAARPVLFVNPRSGGGKVGKLDLAGEARRRGIGVVLLGPGDDLRRLAEREADRGADVLGTAGGDGSQGVVAQVAMERDLAFVCVPVGTRNHFALDLGLDPADPVAALDAFGDAEQRRVDLGLVGDRVFVNNVSLGVYAKIVGTEGYRERKLPTAWQVLPGVFGPEAEPFDLRFTGPDGQDHAGYHLILVANDPYGLTADRRFGSRGSMDRGMLGIVAARAGEGDDFPRFAEAWWLGRPDPSRGWLQWEDTRFDVRSDGPIAAGVDGEAMVFDAPLRFRSLPGALRVRVPAAAGRG
jgi:diacylglycerol kinase family enzyme